jgi:hypothetical protein
MMFRNTWKEFEELPPGPIGHAVVSAPFFIAIAGGMRPMNPVPAVSACLIPVTSGSRGRRHNRGHARAAGQ